MSALARPALQAGAVLLLVVGTAASAAAQPEGGGEKSWTIVKCERYRKAWGEALARGFGRGIGPEFRERHEAFLASGCTGGHDVCPRTEAEMNLADVMTVAAMNAGTASTFPPFGCPR